LQKAGQLDDAARLYREALDEREQFPEALLNLGHVLKDQGKQDEARDCWKKALEQKPEIAGAYFGK
jgi:tetratricopeptide (TPR) repeat protein